MGSGETRDQASGAAIGAEASSVGDASSEEGFFEAFDDGAERSVTSGGHEAFSNLEEGEPLVDNSGVQSVEPGFVPEEGIYLIRNVMDPSLVVDVPSSSLEAGVQVEVFVDHRTLNQLFLVQANEEGYVTVTSVNSGLNLDVAASGQSSGTAVLQWDRFSSNANQQWSLQEVSTGKYRIVSRANDLALDARDGEASSLSVLETRTVDEESLSQVWTLEPVDRLIENGIYSLVAMADAGLVVDVEGSSCEAVVPAELWDRHDTPNQKFSITWEEARISEIGDKQKSGLQPAEVRNADDDEAVVNAVSIVPLTGAGHYLSASDDGVVRFERFDYADRSRQLWIPQVSEVGGFVLVNLKTGRVLDANCGVLQKDAALVVAEASGSESQSFRPVSVDVLEGGTYLIQSLSDDRVLEVEGGSRSNGAPVQVWTRHDGGNQAWVAEKTDGGYYRFLNARSGKALDITYGAFQSGTQIEQYAPNGADSQRWRLSANEDGSLTFYTVDPNLVLDVKGGGGYDGCDVELYKANGGNAQRFRLIPTTYVPKDFEDLIGSFTTYSTNTWNGTYNMQKALDCFNGIVLQPGQSMSFYGVTGRCGAAEGYLPAGVVGGIGYGGGICQASTTIYGAAIRAGFGIVDRQNHSVPSTYVPIGLDAMVSWGTSDLVVRNDTGNPVKILTYTYDNVLTCEFWGIQPEWYDYIEPVSWYTSSNSASAQRVFYKDGTAVYTEWLPSSYYW